MSIIWEHFQHPANFANISQHSNHFQLAKRICSRKVNIGFTRSGFQKQLREVRRGRFKKKSWWCGTIDCLFDKESNRLKVWLVTSTKTTHANGAAMQVHLKGTEDLFHVGEHQLHKKCVPEVRRGRFKKKSWWCGTIAYWQRIQSAPSMVSHQQCLPETASRKCREGSSRSRNHNFVFGKIQLYKRPYKVFYCVLKNIVSSNSFNGCAFQNQLRYYHSGTLHQPGWYKVREAGKGLPR